MVLNVLNCVSPAVYYRVKFSSPSWIACGLGFIASKEELTRLARSLFIVVVHLFSDYARRRDAKSGVAAKGAVAAVVYAFPLSPQGIDLPLTHQLCILIVFPACLSLNSS